MLHRLFVFLIIMLVGSSSFADSFGKDYSSEDNPFSLTNNYRPYVYWADSTETGAGTIDSAMVYVRVLSATGTNQMMVTCWEVGATTTLTTLLSSSTVTDITNTSVGWIKLNMSGTLEDAKKYVIGSSYYNSADFNVKFYPATSAPPWNDIQVDATETDFTAPSNMSAFSDASNFALSVLIYYTPTGASGLSTKISGDITISGSVILK